MKCWLKIGILLLVFVAGCNNAKNVHFVCEAEPQAPISITCNYKADFMLNGPGALAYNIRFKCSNVILSNVTFTINHRWTSKVANVLVYKGFTRGSERYGKNNIYPNSVLRIMFSHDIPNHAVFKDNSGSRMPVNERIHNITVAFTNNAYVFREVASPRAERSGATGF